MKSVFDFFHMGGYARYVWWSFGVTLMCLVFEVWFLKQRRKELLKRLIALQGRKS